MRSQTTTPQPIGGVLSIRRCRQKISAQRKENFGLACMHRLNSAHGIMTMTAWRLKIKLRAQLVEKCIARPFPNSHRAIALHIAVSPYRAETCARFSHLPAQEHQINDLLNVSHRVLVLCQAHGPTEDCSFRFNKDFRSIFDMRLGNSALLEQIAPVRVLDRLGTLRKTFRVVSDKVL